MKPLRCLVIAFLLIAGGLADVSAEGRFPIPLPLKELMKPGIGLNGPVHMTADTLSYDEETGVALAEGNVEMAFGTRTMRAERIRYDSATGEADLTGKVRYKDASEEFAFDRITINLDSEKGVLYNGTIRISSSTRSCRLPMSGAARIPAAAATARSTGSAASAAATTTACSTSDAPTSPCAGSSASRSWGRSW